jgi:minor extracellular serine protease Vpr
MKRWFNSATAVALLAVVLAAQAWTQEEPAPEVTPEQHAVTLEDGSELWFVEMAGLPTADGGDLNSILAEQSVFRASAAQQGIRSQERKAFKTLWNGLSIAVHPGDLPKLRRIENVTLYPVIVFQIPETQPIDDTQLLTALAMTGANVAQNDLGLTGAGIKVGVIDGGIDYDHADLGGDGINRTNSPMFPNSRVITGYDFVGDAFTGGNTPMPDNFPDDCGGHGTHVSGIIGANGLIKGVAPGVLFGAYRVVGCGTTTNADVMIDAMERAMADGMQVINMSIGSPTQWPSYPTAKTSDLLVKNGIVVVASIGNSGLGQPSCCLYASSAPGVGKKVIGVASFDNTHTNQFAFTATPDNAVFGYNVATGAPAPPGSGTYPLARTGTASSLDDACNPLPAGSLAGKVALIRRGTCTFYQKAINAQNAGAIAVVLYNNAAGPLNPTVVPPLSTDPPVTIPVVAITAALGGTLDSRLAAGPVDITWGAQSSTANANGSFVSGFSSLGLGPDLSVKPNIGAPGGFILSTVPLSIGGGYGQNSGTSMASPHVAGAVALLLEARPNQTPGGVRTLIVNNATPRPRSAVVSAIDMVHRQGAGLLDIPSTVLARTKADPEMLELGETEGGSVTQTLTLRNEGSNTIAYSLSHQAALASPPGTFTFSGGANAPSNVSFSANPVIVPPGGTGTVDVTVTPNATLANRSLFGGYVVITPDDGGLDVRVPFAGFKGDYQSIQVLVATANNFPRLARQVSATTFQLLSGPASFNMQGFDRPNIAVHFDHQPEIVRVEIFDAATGESRHRAFQLRQIGRNSSATGFFALPWDGFTFHGQHVDSMPNGSYTMKLSVLKARGDDDNAAHWETWTSPVVTIARPNLVVSNFAVSQNSVLAGDQVTLSATVQNSGASPYTGVQVEFFDNDVLIGESTLDVDAGQSQLVESSWLVGPEQQHRIRVKVSTTEFEASYGDNETGTDLSLGQAIVGVGPQVRVLSLAPARPNPSNGRVAFRFTLPEQGPVAFEVFDLAGRRLKSWRWSNLEPGEHALDWDGRTEQGRSAPAGTLLLRLNAMGRTLTQKAVRLP